MGERAQHAHSRIRGEAANDVLEEHEPSDRDLGEHAERVRLEDRGVGVVHEGEHGEHPELEPLPVRVEARVAERRVEERGQGTRDRRLRTGDRGGTRQPRVAERGPPSLVERFERGLGPE